MGALTDSSATWMPVRKLPVRRTSTHCTTGSVPITVHARRVRPVAPPSEYAVGEVELQDLHRARAQQAPVVQARRHFPHARRALAAAAQVGEHRAHVSLRLRLDQRLVGVAFLVLNRQEPRQHAADREEQEHGRCDQDDAFQNS